MSRRLAWLALSLAGAAVAFVAGRAVAPVGTAAPRPPAVSAARLPPAPAQGQPSWPAIRAELRAIVRDELAATAAAPERACAEPGGAQPPARAAAEPEAVDAAVSVVDGAVALGRWTDSDADALRPLLDTLAPSQQEEVLSRLAVAINEQRIVLDRVSLL
jgi:hypothetical protein